MNAAAGLAATAGILALAAWVCWTVSDLSESHVGRRRWGCAGVTLFGVAVITALGSVWRAVLT